MHYGTVRGGISQYYEDVRTPPKNWKEAADAAGLKWGEEIGLVNIGETLVLG
jgi:N-acyl-phosphatidylethanolamine-hydrolysing phospholipase D